MLSHIGKILANQLRPESVIVIKADYWRNIVPRAVPGIDGQFMINGNGLVTEK